MIKWIECRHCKGTGEVYGFRLNFIICLKCEGTGLLSSLSKEDSENLRKEIQDMINWNKLMLRKFEGVV